MASKIQEAEAQTSPTQSLPSMVEIKETLQSNRRFRVHVFIAGIASIIVSIVNMISQLAGASYPWAAFVYGFFCMTLSFHFFLFNRPTKEFLNFHFSIFSVVVGVNTIIWVWARSSYCWPLNIVFGWGILLGAHWSAIMFKDSPHRGLYIHLTMFTSLQLLLLVIFLNSMSEFPWFLLSFFGVALFPLIHWTLHYHPGNKFRLHLAIFADVQLICFFTWLASKGFPWFYIVLFAWGAILALHFFINKRRAATQYQEAQSVTAPSFIVQVPVSESAPAYQPPAFSNGNFTQMGAQPIPMVYPEQYRPQPMMYPQISNPFPPTYQQVFTEPQNKV